MRGAKDWCLWAAQKPLKCHSSRLHWKLLCDGFLVKLYHTRDYMASYYIEVTLILRHQQFLVARTLSCLVSVAAMSTHYGHLLGQKVLYSAPKSSEVLQAYLFLLYLILRSHFLWEIWIKVSLGFAGGFRFYVKNTHWIYIVIYICTQAVVTKFDIKIVGFQFTIFAPTTITVSRNQTYKR